MTTRKLSFDLNNNRSSKKPRLIDDVDKDITDNEDDRHHRPETQQLMERITSLSKPCSNNNFDNSSNNNTNEINGSINNNGNEIIIRRRLYTNHQTNEQGNKSCNDENGESEDETMNNENSETSISIRSEDVTMINNIFFSDLQSDDYKKVIDSLEKLEVLCKGGDDDDNDEGEIFRDYICSNSYIGVLVYVLTRWSSNKTAKSTSIKILTKGFMALQNIMYDLNDNSLNVASAFLTYDIVITSMKQHSNNPSLQSAAFGALSNMFTMKSVASIVQPTIVIKLVVSAMKTFQDDYGLQSWGCQALNSYSLYCCTDGRHQLEQMIELDCLSVLSTLVMTEPQARTLMSRILAVENQSANTTKVIKSEI